MERKTQIKEKDVIDAAEHLVEIGLLKKKKGGYINSDLAKPFFKHNLQGNILKIVNLVEQSALAQKDKEIDDLKMELNRSKHLVDSWITECGNKEDKIVRFKVDKQKQVRKLKDRLAYYHKWSADELNGLDEIFPDCAEKEIQSV